MDLKKRLEEIVGLFAKIIRKNPSNKDLEQVFENALCAKVYDSLLVSQPKFLLELRGEDLTTLLKLLEIADDKSVWFANETGDFVVEIIKSDGTSTELRHLGESLRHPNWLLDGILMDGAALGSWLTDEKRVTLGEFHLKKKEILGGTRESTDRVARPYSG